MSASEPQASRTIHISKYPNRRFYDSTRSRHVTLEDIHTLIRDGYDVQVVDSQSGQDITGKILAQILLELDPPKLGVFPVPLLHKLLRSSEQLVTDFVQKYFNEALESFLDSQRNMEQMMRNAMGLPRGGATLADWTKFMWTPPKAFPWGVPPPAAGGGQGAPIAETEELRAKVQELQGEIERLRGRSGAKPKARARKRGGKPVRKAQRGDK